MTEAREYPLSPGWRLVFRGFLLAQVAQWDVWTHHGITMLNLRDAGGKSLGQIPLFFKRDAAFDDWLSFAPNRHELRAAAELASIQQEKLLGASPEGRVIQMERARRVMWALNFFSVFCAVWLFVYPKYEELAVVSCLIQPPLVIALMFLFPGAYDLEFDDHQVRPTAAIPLMTSSFALGFRSLMDGQVVEWVPLVLPFLFGTFILGAVLWMASRPGRVAPFVFSMCVLWANPLGAWVLLNRYLDRSPILEMTTVVVQRMEKVDQRVPLSLLTLTSQKWGKDRTIQIDSAWQRVSEVGDARCFVIHPGAFGMRWFSLDFSCDKPTTVKTR